VPRSPDPARVALWSERLLRLQQSGLTVAQFCKQESLNVCSLYQWKKKLGPAGGPSRMPAPKFVALQVLPAPQSHQAVLKLPSGLSIELPLSLPREAITGIVAACIEATALVGPSPERQ
jgi:hypothetical protein